MSKFLIPQDKANHFICGSLLAAVCFPFIGWWAAAPCVLMAVGKEAYDYAHQDKHTPDVMDAIWTMVGSASVLISHVSLNLT